MTGSDYELALESRVADAQPEYRFRTADGVCSKRSFRTPELLLSDVLWDAAVDRLLVPEANYGVVGVLTAEHVDRVEMTESSARAVGLCERNAAKNCVDASVALATGIASLGEPNDGGVVTADRGAADRAFDALAYAPKPYTSLDVGAQHLADAAAGPCAGGRIFLAASKRTGLARYESVLADIAEYVECVATRDGYRVLEASVPSRGCGDEFDPPSYVEPRTFDTTVSDVDLSLVSVPGVFSPTRLDDGTRLLAEAATVADGDRVLDLCCGYGALATYAGRVADCEVWLSDDDRVATACAERSLAASGVDGTVVTADGVDGVRGRKFDVVLCNPPTHATDRVIRELFDGVRDVLEDGAELFAVYHADLDLRPQLRAFGDVERVATGAEHVVLRAT